MGCKSHVVRHLPIDTLQRGVIKHLNALQPENPDLALSHACSGVVAQGAIESHGIAANATFDLDDRPRINTWIIASDLTPDNKAESIDGLG